MDAGQELTAAAEHVQKPAARSEPADKFPFGANWARFLSVLNDERIAAARNSLAKWLPPETVRDKRFLDAGCGSGLFSLAASQLGASVLSFDVDPQSVACAQELRRRYGSDDARWDIQGGSLLDGEFLAGLGEFDVVYSWGVVHHTGAMWDVVERLQQRVARGGLLWLAIYNDQGAQSRVWMLIKRGYNRLPKWLRTPYLLTITAGWALAAAVARFSATMAATALRLVTLRDPLLPLLTLYRDLFQSHGDRGMHWWYDRVDWIGGWPFEVATPEEVFRVLRDRGFELVELKTCGGGLGCNEFLFRRR